MLIKLHVRVRCKPVLSVHVYADEGQSGWPRVCNRAADSARDLKTLLLLLRLPRPDYGERSFCPRSASHGVACAQRATQLLGEMLQQRQEAPSNSWRLDRFRRYGHLRSADASYSMKTLRRCITLASGFHHEIVSSSALWNEI